ncbi:MAG: hypothetical protein A2Z15_06485 [Chloroflexi bacterium RBG_16_50_11]|nr:MAG: hypothetical protein A2Z15_06485 [Chloroflexi bacterium RBG_16_50_11]
MNIQGTGNVYEGNQKRAKVRYDLSIEQEYLIAEDFGGSEVTKGGQSGSGIINVLEGKIELLNTGNILTLHMDDGRKQEFVITDGDVNTGRFCIMLSGKFF